MLRRLPFIAILAILITGPLLHPTRAQDVLGPLAFHLVTPADTRADNGVFTVRWEDVRADDITPGIRNITWFWERRSDGARGRMNSLFHDDFARGFRQNWQPESNLQFEWDLRRSPQDPDKGNLLYGGGDAGPSLSMHTLQADSVVSVLARPDGLTNQLRIGIRVQKDGRGIYLRHVKDNRAQVEVGGFTCRTVRLPMMRPGSWYWYELGARTLRGEVNVRVRLLNEDRTELLGQEEFEVAHGARGAVRSVRGQGRVLLQGPAYFAEVYVDPWSARWVDDRLNSFSWNTENLPDGAYRIVAELADQRGGVQRVTSTYEVQVSNSRRAEP